MKKFISIFLILITCFILFAETIPAVKYDNLDFTFQPTMARYDAMGQSGLASPTKIDSFYTNPANLAIKRGFAIAVPSISVTFYNLQKLMADADAMAAFDRIVKGNADDSDPATLATKYLENLGSGKNAITKIDLGLGVQLGIVGLGTNVQVKMHSLNNGSSLVDMNLIPEVNVAQTVALGLKVIDTESLSLSVGAASHGIYKAYFKGIGGNKVINLINNSDQIPEILLWKTPIMGGWAITADLGATLGLFNDTFLISTTSSNINGKYHMQSFGGAGYLINSFSEGAIQGAPEEDPGESVSFDLETPWTLNFGVAYSPKWTLINPTITADLIDMFGMIQGIGKDNFRASDLLLHLNAGFELEVLKVVTARVGVNRGFMSVGAGVNLFVLKIDAAYGWQEFGVELGDKPVDSFTVKIAIGYDR